MTFCRRLVGALALLALGCGGAKQPASGVAPKPASARAPDATVLGVVVHADEHWPLGGRVVEIGGKRAVTDAAGRFRIEGVGAKYDAFVSDVDGSWVSLYRNVSRRDPVLSHHGQDWKTKERERHSARLSVKVEGGVWPLDRDGLSIQVRSASGKVEGRWSENDGPEFGPIRVGWTARPNSTRNWSFSGVTIRTSHSPSSNRARSRNGSKWRAWRSSFWQDARHG